MGVGGSGVNRMFQPSNASRTIEQINPRNNRKYINPRPQIKDGSDQLLYAENTNSIAMSLVMLDSALRTELILVGGETFGNMDKYFGSISFEKSVRE